VSRLLSRRWCRDVGGHSLRIESHQANRSPVSSCAGPPFWVGGAGTFVEFATARKDSMLQAEVALIGRHIPDCAVSMYAVVPVDEASNPALCGGDIANGKRGYAGVCFSVRKSASE